MKPLAKGLLVTSFCSLMMFSHTSNAAENLFQSIAEPGALALEQQKQLARAQGLGNRVFYFTLNNVQMSSNKPSLAIQLTPSLVINAHKVTAENTNSGALMWHGKITTAGESINVQDADTQNDVILIKRGNDITGTVRTNGKLYKIRPIGSGNHAVIEVDESSFPDDHPAEYDLMESQFDALQQQSMMQTGDVQASETPVIRLLVAYTASAASASGNIDNLIDLAIAETNTGYTNSGVDARVELAHSVQVNYSESGSFSTDLSRFRNTNDGYMDNIHSLRDQYAADVGMIVINNSSSCGLASDIGSNASTAFAAVHWDCATGYYSFAHEIGHLQSARHNPEADPNTTPYAYGHGYRYSSGGWRTVMAYNCSPSCTRINWWSNPNKTRNGAAMGTTSTHHNARVLNNTSATLAGFRGVITPPTDEVLENGVAKTNLSGAKDAELRFTMDVPAGATNLNFAINGGSGDADLYVKFASAPTTSVYDCRPWKNGNTESCPISNVQAGTYHVMIRGYSTFSGVSLTGSYNEGGTGGSSFENTQNYNIPDNNATGIESPINVTRSGSSGTVSVEVNIVHTYIGDLIVDVVHPDGTVYNVHNRSGGSADNINQTYSVNAGSKESSGNWKLRVRDRAGADTGYIDSWKVTF